MDKDFTKYICYKVEGNTADRLFLPHQIGRVRFKENQYIKSLKLCNAHDTDAVTVDLYLVDTTVNYVGSDYESVAAAETDVNYYLLNNMVIPNGATLVLGKEDLEYNYALYALTIKLSASDSIVDLKFINNI